MLKYERRLGISADTIDAVKIARLSQRLRCLPSQIRDERADDIEVLLKIEAIDQEKSQEANS